MEPTEVLVVGAGPVGLFAAYCLRKAGIDVAVVDQNEAGTGHSFAVVLHPRTVSLLTDLGVTDPLLWQGQSFERLRVFSEGGKRAVLDIPAPNALAHGGLTLPQDVLRRALEASLRAAGVGVQYGRRFEGLTAGAESVRVRLSSTSKPGGAPGAKQLEHEARFVVGADGHDSSVRRALGVSTTEHGLPEYYEFFDVAGDRAARKDADLVIEELSSAVYPLHGGAARYAFQVEAAPEQPPKRGALGELKRTRMPWDTAGEERVEWSGAHRFVRAIAESFGEGRVWLAGDAAHTTSPLGAQSLNVGLREARDLCHAVVACLQGASLDRLKTGYGAQRRLEWQRLMGRGPPGVRNDAPAWARKHLTRLITSLPASGDDLDDLLGQLSVTLP